MPTPTIVLTIVLIVNGCLEILRTLASAQVAAIGKTARRGGAAYEPSLMRLKYGSRRPLRRWHSTHHQPPADRIQLTSAATVCEGVRPETPIERVPDSILITLAIQL